MGKGLATVIDLQELLTPNKAYFYPFLGFGMSGWGTLQPLRHTYRMADDFYMLLIRLARVATECGSYVVYSPMKPISVGTCRWKVFLLCTFNFPCRRQQSTRNPNARRKWFLSTSLRGMSAKQNPRDHLPPVHLIDQRHPTQAVRHTSATPPPVHHLTPRTHTQHTHNAHNTEE